MFQIAGGSIGLGLTTTVFSAEGLSAAFRLDAALSLVGFLIAVLFVGGRLFGPRAASQVWLSLLAPVPPLRSSAPRPPRRMSSPAPPTSASMPSPPVSTSSPSRPTSRSGPSAAVQLVVAGAADQGVVSGAAAHRHRNGDVV